MNAGKSTSLLQVAHNYEERGQSVDLYTARVDDRYGVGNVTSRLGVTRDAATFTAANVTAAQIILQAVLGFDRVMPVDQKVAFRVKPTCRKRGKKSTAVRRNVTAYR